MAFDTNEDAQPVTRESIGTGESGKIVRIFPYRVSPSRLERAIVTMRVPGVVLREPGDADVVVALKAAFRKEPARIHELRSRAIPIHVVKSNTYIQVENVVREICGLQGVVYRSEEDDAVTEVEQAIDQVVETGEAVELSPRNSYVRRLQHQIVERADLRSESIGIDPRRRLRILPPDPQSVD